MLPLDKNLKTIANKVRNGELDGKDPYWKLNIKWKGETNNKNLTLNIIASQIEKGHLSLKGFASFVSIEEWGLIMGERAKKIIEVTDLLKNQHKIKDLDKESIDKLKAYINKHKKNNKINNKINNK